ncbi:HRDC domain-containing protein [Candidatus Poribacteria bacterium]|nr:HRDC domain-containing protein [Candidatus Poribacteria bacterium]
MAKTEQRRIFNERTLKEMATYFPQTEESFIKIHGVGPKKTERYAKVFLPIIQDYCKKHGVKSVKNTNEALNTSETASEKPNEYAPELFERLREKRKTIADEEGVRPFGVFWNRTLEAMATFFP